MKKLNLLSSFLTLKVIAMFLTSCTYSITMVHTQGEATDVVDETASNTPSTSVSPNISIPAV